MKPLLLAFLLLCLSLPLVLAQDTIPVLKNKGFISKEGKPTESVNLSMLGWVYKPGHNPAWPRPELNTSGWTKRAPTSFSAQDANANGKAEGWFRRRLRIDSTFSLLPLGLGSYAWAASEVYVNGKLVAVFGSTGTRGKPYKEHISNYPPPQPLHLEAGKEYLIAIHLVDYIFPFPPLGPKKLNSEVFKDISGVLILQRPQLVAARYIKVAMLNSGFSSLWLTVSILLALLFWLLSTQELPEKNTIRLWAILETLFAIVTLSYYARGIEGFSFTFYYFIYLLLSLVQWQMLSVGMVAFLEVFGYYIPMKWIRISVPASLGIGILEIYIGPDDILFSVASMCLQLVLIGVIIASWKRLKGAQWAVVVGMGFTGLFAALIAILLLTKTYYFGNMYIGYILTSGLVLSLPLSFLIYLVLRFKETLVEVRTSAAAVVLVTEEKRDLLANQNERLEQQVEARTAELKASQQQLIQKEKMASLGELTAGIAHEIQNPLNFVTNFSEVSTELIEELQEEHQSPTRDIELEAELLSDLKENLQKITQHGQRAASIVKGMLEHSRSSTGEREPTDLNALADEFLRLAYQGQRSKNKASSTGTALADRPGFNCELVTHFDMQLGQVEMVAAEIGRVLLNLMNNAFYAVRERQQQQQQQDQVDYRPTVTVSTRKVRSGVEVEVRDNGTGMAESVRQKVFQPFFTTKPTGEGTGLGLSLSYDIVTKGHGGMLTVNSQEREGTEFVITLPAYA